MKFEARQIEAPRHVLRLGVEMIIRHDIEDFKRTVAEFFDSTVKYYPSQQALVDKGETYTYYSLSEKVKTVATSFKEDFGIKKGDRIAFILKNCKEYVIGFYAAMRIGAIAVPLNVRLSQYEIQYELEDCTPILLIADVAFWDSIKPIMEKIKTCRGCILVGGSEGDQFSHLLEGEAKEAPEIEIEGEDAACILYTSGTTGRPKGALTTHWNIAYSCQVLELPTGLKYLCTAPIFHVTGLYASLNTSVANAGVTVLMERHSTEKALQIIEKEGIEHMVAVPTVLSMMMNWPEVDRFDLSSLKYLAVGGAPLPEDLLDKTMKRLPEIAFLQVFGLTETTGRIVLRECHKTREKFGAVGKKLPGIQTKIIDDSGLELPPNSVGELIVKGPNVIQEYWNKPEATRKDITGGWLHTGDLMKIDDDGYHYIMGRQIELIIRGGENIYPVEVENAICQHPKVLEAAVLGIPDDIYGEEVIAFAVLNEGEYLTIHELQQFCGKYLADYKIPKVIKFVDQLLKSPTGKVLKRELQEMI